MLSPISFSKNFPTKRDNLPITVLPFEYSPREWSNKSPKEYMLEYMKLFCVNTYEVSYTYIIQGVDEGVRMKLKINGKIFQSSQTFRTVVIAEQNIFILALVNIFGCLDNSLELQQCIDLVKLDCENNKNMPSFWNDIFNSNEIRSNNTTDDLFFPKSYLVTNESLKPSSKTCPKGLSQSTGIRKKTPKQPKHNFSGGTPLMKTAPNLNITSSLENVTQLLKEIEDIDNNFVMETFKDLATGITFGTNKEYVSVSLNNDYKTIEEIIDVTRIPIIKLSDGCFEIPRKCYKSFMGRASWVYHIISPIDKIYIHPEKITKFISNGLCESVTLKSNENLLYYYNFNEGASSGEKSTKYNFVTIIPIK